MIPTSNAEITPLLPIFNAKSFKWKHSWSNFTTRKQLLRQKQHHHSMTNSKTNHNKSETAKNHPNPKHYFSPARPPKISKKIYCIHHEKFYNIQNQISKNKFQIKSQMKHSPIDENKNFPKITCNFGKAKKVLSEIFLQYTKISMEKFFKKK